MVTRTAIAALLLAMLIALLALCPVLPAAAQATTQTYTPIPTRTPFAATQAVIAIPIGDSTVTVDKRVTYGDVYVVTAIAALFALGALYWTYEWVKSHIRVQEQ